jgi:hypothetical protein
MSGLIRLGQVSLDGPAWVRSGQVRSGQVRSGQVRSGQVRSGQVRIKSAQVKKGLIFEWLGQSLPKDVHFCISQAWVKKLKLPPYEYFKAIQKNFLNVRSRLQKVFGYAYKTFTTVI